MLVQSRCAAPLASLPLRRRRRAAAASASADAAATTGWSWVDVHEAKRSQERQGQLVLDVRSAREYDREHLTKPAGGCASAPFAGAAAFETAVVRAVGRVRSRGMLVLDAAGGEDAAAAASALVGMGFGTVRAVSGGWAEWRKHYTPSGRDVPPPGRWVPTGTEALKSGLNVGDVAESYEEKLNVWDHTKKKLTFD